MNTEFIKGIIVPILTPVDKNEVIDEGKMRKQVDLLLMEVFQAYWHSEAMANSI